MTPEAAMHPRRLSSVADRQILIDRHTAGSSLAAASRALGYSPDWGQAWWGRRIVRHCGQRVRPISFSARWLRRLPCLALG